MKTIKYMGGPFLSNGGLTYQPEVPLPLRKDVGYREEASRIACHIQPKAMCFIGSSLVSENPKDIDVLVLLGEDTTLSDVSVPSGYELTSPDKKPSPEADVLYPDYLRCFRMGLYNLILTNDGELFRNFRRASLLMTTLADTDDLFRVVFSSKESRVNLYKTIGIVDA